MSTARAYLTSVLEQIEAGPFTVSYVCRAAGMNPSVVSRWKSSDIEPRLSSIERLSDAHDRLQAERKAAEAA